VIIDPFLIDQSTAILLDDLEGMVAIKWFAIFRDELVNTSVVEVE